MSHDIIGSMENLFVLITIYARIKNVYQNFHFDNDWVTNT